MRHLLMFNKNKTSLIPFFSPPGGLGLLDYVYFFGLWLRVCLFVCLDPNNCDSSGHLEHILYIKQHCSLPTSGAEETWQPPFYYIITAVFASISESQKFIQSFSLSTSIATLCVARSLLRSDTLIKTKEGKTFAALIVCFLPQFVMYGLQLSNDSLAILLGFLALQQADRLVAHASAKRFLALVSVLSLGLLTKGQFLVISGMLFPFACVLYFRQQPILSRSVVLVCALALALPILGCTKYIQNIMQHRRPFVSNLDFKPDWLLSNQGTYKGFTSIVDVNVLKLVREPVLSDSTQHSIPLLLYGTFWYHYFNDSSFTGNLLAKPKYIGSFLYLVGIIPTLFVLIGVFKCVTAFGRLVKFRLIDPGETLRLTAAAIFLANIAMLLWVFSKWDAWSILQARSFFPTIFGGFVLADSGIQIVQQKVDVSKLFKIWSYAFMIGVASYYAVELVLYFGVSQV